MNSLKKALGLLAPQAKKSLDTFSSPASKGPSGHFPSIRRPQWALPLCPSFPPLVLSVAPKLRFVLFLFFFFWLHHAACRISVSRPGVERAPSAVKAQSPNHWTAKEFPGYFFLKHERVSSVKDWPLDVPRLLLETSTSLSSLNLLLPDCTTVPGHRTADPELPAGERWPFSSTLPPPPPCTPRTAGAGRQEQGDPRGNKRETPLTPKPIHI